jgi:hypothetical protein
MRARGFALILAASAPPAYAAFVYGYELARFVAPVMRTQAALALTVWAQLALTAAQMVVIGGGLALAWQAAPARRWRTIGVALGVAWLAAAPLYLLLLATRPV